MTAQRIMILRRAASQVPLAALPDAVIGCEIMKEATA